MKNYDPFSKNPKFYGGKLLAFCAPHIKFPPPIRKVRDEKLEELKLVVIGDEATGKSCKTRFSNISKFFLRPFDSISLQKFSK